MGGALSWRGMGGLHLGTSGWSYPEWKGAFYPSRIAGGEMLPFYARHFSTVEINNSFYRMPDPEAVRTWAEQAPPGFLFSFKAHRAITHRKRFAGSSEFLDRFADLVASVGSRLGP